MKKFLLILMAVVYLFPAAQTARAQETSTAPAECISTSCICYWPTFAADGSAILFGANLYERDISSVYVESAEICQANCIVESGLPPEKEHMVQGHYQCQATGLTNVTTEPEKDTIFPCLFVPLTDLKFGDCNEDTGIDDRTLDPTVRDELTSTVQGRTNSNLLGAYVAAMYSYLLVAGAIIAITMMMVGGLQYATSRGDSKQLEGAKRRINNAVVGVILLLLAYNIAFIIDPSTTTFESLSLARIEEIALDASAQGPEGYAPIVGGTGTWENLKPDYKALVSAAKAQPNGCFLGEEGLASPTEGGTLPNQGHHHWETLSTSKPSYTAVYKLDWAAPWNSVIKSPVSGTIKKVVTRKAGEDLNACGNAIVIKSNSGQDTVTICHVKDFITDQGVVVGGQVTQGQAIGHVGGRRCAGVGNGKPGWYASGDTSGTACTDPNKLEQCDCQILEQAGSTTGPHIHITFEGKSNILSCLK